MEASARPLPARLMKERILEKVSMFRVTLLQGETGSGKTSQVPQMLLDSDRDAAGVVLCTQPRRLAVVSVARRVAQERGVALGAEVGFHVGQTPVYTKGVTRILFVTAGILLEELRACGLKALDGYGVVCLDEVHERSIESDLVLACVREFMRQQTRLRLVLMSATVNMRRYMDYFADVCSAVGERFQSLCITPYGAHLASRVFTKRVGYLEEAVRLVRRYRRWLPPPSVLNDADDSRKGTGQSRMDTGAHYGLHAGGAAGRRGWGDPYQALLDDCCRQAPQADTQMAVPESMHALLRDLILAVLASDRDKDGHVAGDDGNPVLKGGEGAKMMEVPRQVGDQAKEAYMDASRDGGGDVGACQPSHAANGVAVGKTAVTAGGSSAPSKEAREGEAGVANGGLRVLNAATGGPSGRGRPMVSQLRATRRKFLVFLPTYRDLERQHSLLTTATAVGGTPLEVHVLHSSVDIAACLAVIEQRSSPSGHPQEDKSTRTSPRAPQSAHSGIQPHALHEVAAASQGPSAPAGAVAVTPNACSQAQEPPPSSSSQGEQSGRAHGPPSAPAVVILATNIAESSVTVAGVNCVVDLCRTLQVRWHAAQGRHLPCVVPASLSQIEQRAGRTGRTCDGEVFRLIPRAHKGSLPREETPATELLSLWLQSLTLVSGSDARMADPHYVFSRCLNPPDPAVVDTALQVLCDIHTIVPRASSQHHHHHGGHQPTTAAGGGAGPGRPYQPQRWHLAGGMPTMGASAQPSSARHAPSPLSRFEPTRYGIMLASMPVSLEAALLAVEAGRHGLLREGAILAGLLSAKAYPILRPFGDVARYRSTLWQMGLPRHTPAEDDAYVLLLNLSSVLFWEREWRDARRWRRLGFGSACPVDGAGADRREETEDEASSYLHGGGSEEGAWCRRHGLIPSALHSVRATADILVEAVHRARPDFLPLGYRTGPPAYFGSVEPAHHAGCRGLTLGACDPPLVQDGSGRDGCPGTGLEGRGLVWYSKEEADFLHSLVVAAISSDIVAHMAKGGAPGDPPRGPPVGSQRDPEPYSRGERKEKRTEEMKEDGFTDATHLPQAQSGSLPLTRTGGGMEVSPHTTASTGAASLVAPTAYPPRLGHHEGGQTSQLTQPRGNLVADGDSHQHHHERDDRGKVEQGGDEPAGEGEGAHGPPLCIFFQRGRCNRGDACTFRHVAGPAVAACPAFESGQGCALGRACQLSHASWSTLPWSPPSFPEEGEAWGGPVIDGSYRRQGGKGGVMYASQSSRALQVARGAGPAATSAPNGVGGVLGCEGQPPLLDCPENGGFVLVVGDPDLSLGEGVALGMLRSPEYHALRVRQLASALGAAPGGTPGLAPYSDAVQSCHNVTAPGASSRDMRMGALSAVVGSSANVATGLIVPAGTAPAIILSSPLSHADMRVRFGSDVPARMWRLAPFCPALQVVPSLDPTQLPDAWVFREDGADGSSNSIDSVFASGGVGVGVGGTAGGCSIGRRDGCGDQYFHDGAGRGGHRSIGDNCSTGSHEHCYAGDDRHAGIHVPMSRCCRIVWAFPRADAADAGKRCHMARLAAFFRAAATVGLIERMRPPCVVGGGGAGSYNGGGVGLAGMHALGVPQGNINREVVLVLCNNQFSHWKVESLARECFYFLRGYWPFEASSLPGYIPRGDVQDLPSQGVERPMVYCFRLCLPPNERFGSSS